MGSCKREGDNLEPSKLCQCRTSTTTDQNVPVRKLPGTVPLPHAFLGSNLTGESAQNIENIAASLPRKPANGDHREWPDLLAWRNLTAIANVRCDFGKFAAFRRKYAPLVINEEPKPDRLATRSLGALIGLVLPSAITWIYFVEAADLATTAEQGVGVATKVLQFAFPALWVLFVLGERLSWPRPTWRGVPFGIAFGVAVTLAGFLIYQFLLRGSAPFSAAVDQIREKVVGFGLDSTARYAMLALFYSLIHSLLEEYYWRWFVFGQLRRLMPRWAAILTSAVGFMAHHVIVLSLYFGWWTWPTMLLSIAVAIGGLFWAWLYDRSGSLYGPWLSHLIVDAGIFWIGYDLIGSVLRSTA